MGTVIEFPGGVSRRRDASRTKGHGSATVVILPVVRIERHAEDTSDGKGPRHGAASGGRRRRGRS